MTCSHAPSPPPPSPASRMTVGEPSPWHSMCMSWPSTGKRPAIPPDAETAGEPPADDELPPDDDPDDSARALGGAVPEHAAATIATTTARNRTLIDLPPAFAEHDR